MPDPIPFSTALLAEFMVYRVALIAYWANIFLLGALLLAAWRMSRHFALAKPDLPPDIDGAIYRRIIVAQQFHHRAASCDVRGARDLWRRLLSIVRAFYLAADVGADACRSSVLCW